MDSKEVAQEQQEKQQDSNDDDFKSCEDNEEQKEVNGGLTAKDQGNPFGPPANDNDLFIQETTDDNTTNKQPNNHENDQYSNQYVFTTDGNEPESGASSFASSAYSRSSWIGMGEIDQPDGTELTQNPYIMAEAFSMGPLSFIDSRQPPNEKAPPPKYFTPEFIKEKFALPIVKNQILYGYEQPSHGGLVCTDEEMLNRQKGVLSEVAKQLVKNALKGLQISHMSLPIKIFEPRSSIQRIVDLWTFAPKFLRMAAETDDHLERLKLTIAFAMSSIYMCVGQEKPFNPLLGETHQGSFPDGSRFFCEHTSHHPPITNFLLEDKDDLYMMYGYYEVTGKMGANNFQSGMCGPNNLVFKDGQHIRFGFPQYKLGGTIMGERSIEAIGSCTFEDLTNNRKAVLLMSTYKTSGYIRQSASGCKDKFEGVIYDSKPLSGNAQSIKENYSKDIQFVTDLKKIKDVKKMICNVTGSWLENCLIDKQVYWDIDKDVPMRQQPLINNDVLPSDWRYREDLIWLKYGYMRIAAQWKLRLEVQQRADRSQRKAGAKKRQPKQSKRMSLRLY